MQTSWRDRPGRVLAVALAALVVLGVAGYLAAGYSFLDAVHHTVLVLTTVGFTPQPDPGSFERILTASLAALGTALVLAAIALFATALVERRLGVSSRRKRMDRRIRAMSNHFVICAYGRVGRAAARELEAQGVPFVVVDRLEDLEPVMRNDGVAYFVGDPTNERVLRHVGIEKARGLLSAVDSDADNVYITLTARALNPSLFIVARASEAAAADRLYRAGAQRVVSPYVSSGRHMAALAIAPKVIDYLDLAGPQLRLEELVVEPQSAGRKLTDLVVGATPLVVRRSSGEVVAHPNGDQTVAEGDLVVVLGDVAAPAQAKRSRRRV